MGDEEEFLWFTSLEMEGSPERRENIEKPVKKPKIKRPLNFIRDMEEFQNQQVENAEFCPYHDPWPNYQTMTDEQKQWYFFWRTQVREGWFPFTDFGYIYVLTFEYLNGFGWEKPEEGYEKLLALWKAYGGLDDTLFHEFQLWIFDFLWLNQLNPHLYLQQAKISNLTEEQINLLYHYYSSISPLDLPLFLLIYQYPRLKRLEELAQQNLLGEVQSILLECLRICDEKCLRTRNKGIFDLYRTEKKTTYSRFCYQNAKYISSKPSFSTEVYDHVNYDKILLFFASFLDFTLWCLADMWDLSLDSHSASLGLGLEDEITAYLEEFHPVPNFNQGNFPRFQAPLDLFHIIQSSEKEQKKVPTPKTTKKEKKTYIDPEKLDQLRQVAEELEITLDFSKFTQEMPVTTYIPKEKTVEKPAEVVLNLDFSEIDKLREESDFVRDALAVEEVEISSDVQESATFSEDAQNTETEEAQESSTIPEEQVNPEEMPSLPPVFLSLWQTYSRLHQKTLVLVAKEDWDSLDALALEEFSMIDLLVDEINSQSMEELGDTILEIPVVYPEFLEEYQDIKIILKDFTIT